MVKEAEANAESDKKKRELVDARNHADGLAHQVESQLKEHGEKLGPDAKAECEAAVAAVRAVLDGSDIEALKSATERLSQTAMKIGEAIYKAQAASPEAGPSAAPGGDDVVDAEFEDVDANKKKPS